MIAYFTCHRCKVKFEGEPAHSEGPLREAVRHYCRPCWGVIEAARYIESLPDPHGIAVDPPAEKRPWIEHKLLPYVAILATIIAFVGFKCSR